MPSKRARGASLATRCLLFLLRVHFLLLALSSCPLSRPPPSPSASRAPPPPPTSFIHHPERSSSVPQYVTTRHTLLAGAQDNCPHYSYLKSAPRARASARARAAASTDAIAPRYKDAAERELSAEDGGGWRKMQAGARPRASTEAAADSCLRVCSASGGSREPSSGQARCDTIRRER